MPTISQRIALEGGEEIRRQLQAMGRAGSASFEEIEAAGIKAAQGLDRVVTSVRRVEVAFATLGAQAQAFGARFSQVATNFSNFESAILRTARNTGILATALAGATAATVGFVKSAADAADTLEEQAQAAGVSAEALQGLRLGAAQAGVDSERLGRSLGKLAAESKKAADEQKKIVNELAQGFLGTFGARFGRTLTAPMQTLAETMKLVEPAAKLVQEELKKIGRDVPLSFIIQKFQQAARTVSDFRGVLEKLGIKLPITNEFEKLDRLLREQTGKSLTDLGIKVTDATGKMRPLEDQLGDLAEEFKRLGAGPEATALAIEKFTARAGPRLLPLLLQGRAGIRALIEEFEKLGVGFTRLERESGGKLSDSFVQLGEVLTGLKNVFGAQFFGLFQEAVDELNASLLGSASAVRGLGQQIAGSLTPIVRNLRALFTGRAVAGSDLEVVTRWRRQLEEFKRQVLQVVTIVVGAFRLLIAGADQVARVLNAIFGTQFTGPALLAAAAVLKFLGVFALVGAAIKLVTSSIGLVVSGFLLLGRALAALGAAGGALRFVPLLLAGLVNLPALIVVALAGLTAVFLTNRDEIIKIWKGLEPAFAKITKAIVDGIKKDLGIKPDDTLFSWIGRALDAELVKFGESVERNVQILKDKLSNAGTFVWTWIVDSFEATMQAVLKKAQEFIDKLKQIVTKSPEQGGQLGGQGVPLLGEGRDFLPESPASVNIEDRRDPQLENMVEAARSAFDEIFQIAQQAWEAIAQGAEAAAVLIGASFGQLGSTITSALNISGAQTAFTELEASAAGAMQNIASAIQQATQALLEFINAANQAAQSASGIDTGGAGGGNGGFAGGGMIRGRGTSTSDSILARLSRGEYVVRAAAVRHYGPALLSAINSLRIPRPTGFNLGGLVNGMQRSLSALMIPRFAEGGLADLGGGGGRPIALTINAGGDRQTFHVWADERVAESVLRYATKRQVASAGRKSGAFG